MKNDLCERTFNFSVRVYNLCKELNKNGINEAIITRQLLRSGTSIGANVEEAQAGQSRADFLSKYNIALKEAGETHYWLKLLNAVSIFAEDKLESLEENYKSSKNKKEKYQETSIRLSAEIESLNKNIKDRTHKVEKKAKELEHLIKEKGYKSIEKIKEILKKSIDIEEAKKEIENYDKSLVELKISINNLKSQLEGKVFDESEFIKVSDSHKKAQDNWELITRKEGELKNEKKMIESKLMEKEQIEKNLKKLEVRGELIKKVRKLLEGKKFVKYISLVFLKNLISIANKRFRKFTKEQLRLEFDENGEIIVRDYLNDGYSRSINTLSGGQMFQASFSMSLALASMANKEDKSFFFMDEGFGSQDKDSLSIILNTIKSLRKENKIIGIISHLDELQYEIDTYILVKHSEKIGSSIESNL